jgi:RNA polymerase sigma-70 factor, ECF subfamily
LESPTDAELMSRARSGDHDAFAAIVDRYKDSLVNYMTHLSGSRDKGEDVAQEAFIRLYQSRASYDEQGKLAPYLFRIATNHFRSELRRAKRWKLMMLDFSNDDAAGSPTPYAEMMQSELQQKLSAELSALPVHYRSAIVLRELEGWSYDEIARALECSTGTVKSRINRGRERLRQALAPYWNGVRA